MEAGPSASRGPGNEERDPRAVLLPLEPCGRTRPRGEVVGANYASHAAETLRGVPLAAQLLARLAIPSKVDSTPTTEDFMSLVARFSPVGMTIEQYQDAIRRHAEAGVEFPPDGMELHVCFGSDGDLRVSEIWDSREQLQAYGERLMPILAETGVQLSGEPEIYEVHNIAKR